MSRWGMFECLIRLSASFRMIYSLRSKPSASLKLTACEPADLVKKSWRMHGSLRRAVGPMAVLSVGTVRQPMSLWPSSRMTFSMMCSQRWRSWGACGKKMRPVPYSPSAGKFKLSLVASARKNRSGICIRMPAPSPVLTSQPQAPRCSRFKRICSASCTIWCDLRFFKSAMKPTPHASCSYCGS